jgi:hypothetical protein
MCLIDCVVNGGHQVMPELIHAEDFVRKERILLLFVNVTLGQHCTLVVGAQLLLLSFTGSVVASQFPSVAEPHQNDAVLVKKFEIFFRMKLLQQ